LEYRFDRWVPTSLRKPTSCGTGPNGGPSADGRKNSGFTKPITEVSDEQTSRHLRAGLLGSAEGESHHRQPNGSADRYAQTHEYSVPPEWIFQDEAIAAPFWSGQVRGSRDLAAEGQIAAALIYSPDRLSRKYATKFC